jgi:hypothetical protein
VRPRLALVSCDTNTYAHSGMSNRPWLLTSGRVRLELTLAVNQFVPRQAQQSALKCTTNAALVQTCADKSMCFLANPDCTQVSSPEQAAEGVGAKGCFSQCPTGGCVLAAFTSDGKCLVFTQDCCPRP